MSSGRNVMFPRASVPSDVGRRVRSARERRGWSQQRLARAVGVDRRTVIRLEAGAHRPTFHLVHALEEVLSLVRLVPGWSDPAVPDSPSYGPRARLARLAAGVSQVDAAMAAGVSPATLSRFEREMGDTPLLLDERGLVKDAYAAALGFADAREMDGFCMSDSAAPWMRILAERRSH